MATRQELEILLKARNETDAAFKALSQAVRAVEGETEKTASGFRSQAKAVDEWFGKHDAAFKNVAAGAAVVGGAVIAMGAGIYALGQRGSDVLNVTGAFQKLTTAAGLSYDLMLTEGRQATRGMISDYDLMLNANRLLGAQLPITESQFATMSRQAIALGRSVGKDAAESLDRLAMGLSKVEPELLDEINLKVDAVAANKAMAASLGISTEALSSQQRQIAFVNAVMEQMATRTATMGDLTLTFADRVAIGKTQFKNMLDVIGQGVALSPSMNKALDLIGLSLLDAFGTNKQQTLQKTIEWVDYFAQITVKTAQAVVTGAKYMGQAYYGFRVLFEAQMFAVTGVIELVMKAQLKLFEVGAKIPGPMMLVYGKLRDELREVVTWTEGARQGFGKAAGDSARASEAWGKKNDDLNASLSSMLAAMQKASAEGPKMATAQTGVARATDTATASTVNQAKEAEKARKELEAFLKVIDKQNDALDISNAELKWAAVYWKQYADNVTPFVQMSPKLVTDTYELAAGLKGVGIAMDTVNPKTISLTEGFDELEDAAAQSRAELDAYGENTARNIIGAFDTIANSFDGITGRILSGWVGMFDAMVQASQANGGKLWDWMSGASNGGTVMGPDGKPVSRSSLPGSLGSGGSSAGRVGAGLSVGVESFGQGYQFGAGYGKTVGTLAGAGSGAATGALIGTYVMPGLGTGTGAAIGAIAGGLGGYLGGRKKDKEDKAALAELQKDLLATYGGMERLKKLADDVGVNIDKAFSSKKPADALKVIEQFSMALDKQKEKLEGINTATEGLNDRAVVAFAGGIDQATGKVMALGEAGQKEFDRLAIYATAAFAATVKETGNLGAALDAIEPTLAKLVEGQKLFGFEGNETINKLLGFREVVNANRDVFDSLAANTKMMEGFGAAGVMTRGLFNTFAEDAAAQYEKLTGRGVDANDALVAMAPTLQELYEGQKKYGGVTDETTAKLIEQAKEQGLVGDHMMGVNEQILQATLDISSAIKDLAAAMRGELPAAASAAAGGIQEAFHGTRIVIPVEYDDGGGYRPNGGDYGGERPGYATGGTIPFTPGGRIVRVGERGTERIVSDEQLTAIVARAMAHGGGMGGGGTVVIHNEIGGQRVNTHIVDTAKAAMRNGQIPVPRKAVVEKVF